MLVKVLLAVRQQKMLKHTSHAKLPEIAISCHPHHSLSPDPPADILHQYPSASPGKPPLWHRADICRLPAAPSPAESRDAAHARRPGEHIFYQPAIGFIIRQLHRAVCPGHMPVGNRHHMRHPDGGHRIQQPEKLHADGQLHPACLQALRRFSPSAPAGAAVRSASAQRCAPLPRRGKNHRHTA